MEGSRVGSAAWACSACCCAWSLRVCVVDGSNLIAAEHGRCSLSCMQKLWSP